MRWSMCTDTDDNDNDINSVFIHHDDTKNDDNEYNENVIGDIDNNHGNSSAATARAAQGGFLGSSCIEAGHGDRGVFICSPKYLQMPMPAVEVFEGDLVAAPLSELPGECSRATG